jgi:hypothetical protein
VKKRLDRSFGDAAWHQSYTVWRHAVDTLTDIIIDAWHAGIAFKIDDVREWASERSWPQADIDELATMAETIYRALRRAGVITR